MSDNNFTNEPTADVEEAIPAKSGGVSFSSGDHPEASANKRNSLADQKRELGAVSCKYDLDGDGQLDEAEQAMRNMDKSGRGFLKNDEVYGMMKDQLQMQKDLFKMKKVIAGLMVFVVILALSNLGTSFASAILAKDSTTNDQNELVSKETGEALATQSTTKLVVITLEEDAEYSRRHRMLCETSGQGNTVTSADCNVGDLQAISETHGEDIVKYCHAGASVTIGHIENGNEVQRAWCPAPSGSQVSYSTWVNKNNGQSASPGDNNAVPSEMTIVDGADTHSLTRHEPSGQDVYYTLTSVTAAQQEPEPATCEVCVATDGGGASCSTAANAGDSALVTTECQCGGVSGFDPNNNCEQSYCEEIMCAAQMVWCSDCSTPSQDACTCAYTCSGGATLVYNEPTCGGGKGKL